MEEGGSGLVVEVFVVADQAGPAGLCWKWSGGAESFGSALARGCARSCAFCAWKSLGSFPQGGTVSASEMEVMCQPGGTGGIGNMLRMRRRLL